MVTWDYFDFKDIPGRTLLALCPSVLFFMLESRTQRTNGQFTEHSSIPYLNWNVLANHKRNIPEIGLSQPIPRIWEDIVSNRAIPAYSQHMAGYPTKSCNVFIPRDDPK